MPLLAERIDAALVRWGPAASRPRTALDVGCGGQPLRPRLEALGYAYTGLDTAPGPGVDVVCMIDEASLPPRLLELAPFDFVLCTEVLEHVADWGAAMHNLASLTAPGGRILLTCPAVYPLHEEPYDFWRPTPYAFRHYAQREGLDVVHEERAGDVVDVLGTILNSTEIVPARAGLASRVATSAASRMKALVAGILLRRRFDRYVKARGAVYLSNVVVLERPTGGV